MRFPCSSPAALTCAALFTAAYAFCAESPPAITYAVKIPAKPGASVTDAQGNAYIASVITSRSGTFTTTPGVVYPSQQADTGSTLVKLDSRGQLVFCTYMVGNVAGIALDQAGNIYLTGITSTSLTSIKAFVAEIDPAGARRLYYQELGGSGGGVSPGDSATGIAVDARGYVYLTGQTYSPDFPVTAGAFQTKINGNGCLPGSACGGDVFIAKLDPKTGMIVFATYLGGLGSERPSGLAVDTEGAVYVAGTTTSSDFPLTAGAFQPVSHPSTVGLGEEGFISKLNAAGSALVYSTFLGGSKSDEIAALVVDATGSAYVTGGTGSSDFPTTPGTFKPASPGGGAFVTRLSLDGRSLIFSTFLHGGDSSGRSVAVEPSGNVIVGGATYELDFPVFRPLQTAPASLRPFGSCTYGPPDYIPYPCWNGFLTKFDPEAKALIWSSYLSGSNVSGWSLSLDAVGNLYASGVGFLGFYLPASKRSPLAWDDNSFAIKVEPVGPPPLLTAAGVVNAAGFAPRISAGGLVSIFGTGLTGVNGIVAAPGFPLPAELAGTSVWIEGCGTAQAQAPVLAVANVNGQEQINVQVPFESSPPCGLIVNRNGVLGFVADTLTYGATAPGVFTAPDGTAAIQHADYSLVTGSNPSRAGEAILVYAAGLGPVSPQVPSGAAAPSSPLSRTTLPVTAKIGGLDAVVTFAGLAPGFAGLYQVNVVVPPAGAGPQDLTLYADRVPGAAVRIPVQ